MEQLTTTAEDQASIKPAHLDKQTGRLVSAPWLQRARQSRAGIFLSSLFSSFPSRVFLLAFAGYLALTSLSLWLNGVPNSQQAAPGAVSLATWGTDFTAAWARFDSHFFLHIAQYSYTDQGLGAFFPLYPLLVRLCAWPLAGHFTFAALLVSWLCAWGSYIWFYQLARREYGARVARAALLFLALSPVSFFSFAPYSESLFLLVSIGAVERARAGRLWQASLLAALGMLTRPTGILLLIPLAWECGRRAALSDATPAWLRRCLPGWLFQIGAARQTTLPGTSARPARDKPLPRFAWLALGLVPLALLGYMLFLKLHTGNALAFLKGENAWHRHLALPWETAGLFAVAFQHAWQTGELTVFIGNLFDLLLVIPLPALVLYCAIKRKNLWLGAALYQLALALMLIAVPQFPGPAYGEEVLLSTQRFMLPAFPIFLLLGQFGAQRPKLYRVLLIASSALLLLNTWRFLNGVFVA